MKNKLKIIALLTLIIIAGKCSEINADKGEVRAVWLATAWGLDWPKSQSNIEKQKSEFIDILNELEETGINTIMFQVRGMGDALYNSNINPWSSVLTGIQGKDPGYDPLQFVIDESHKRGIRVHAWLNPYRVMTSGTDIKNLSINHPARKNPGWTIEYEHEKGTGLWYNPELVEVKKHIADSVEEIISNYNVDGIVFDDYFYPESHRLPDKDKDSEIGNLRRNHINDMIKLVSETIEQINPNVKFGVSPSGIWKNKSSDPTGSYTNGNESYYSVSADTRTWIKNEWIDYVSPQIYWQIGDEISDYSKLIEWWSNEVQNTDVDLYISHTLAKTSTAIEIDKQLNLNTKYDNINGSIFYRTSNLISNQGGSKDKIRQFYDMQDDNKIYYLDINSFLGEENASSSLNKLYMDTGWYLEKKRIGEPIPVYKIETGGFIGEDRVKKELETLREITGLEGEYKFTGSYSQTEGTPIYRIETGGFVGEESAKAALNHLQQDTGWWATYEPNGNIPNEYKIVTGGFVGEESVKSALKYLRESTGWWAEYKFTGSYTENNKIPIYRIDIDGFIGEYEAQVVLQNLKNKTGWWAEYKFSNKYEYYYKIVTGGFVGLENTKKQSEFVKNRYGWYNEIKEQ